MRYSNIFPIVNPKKSVYHSNRLLPQVIYAVYNVSLAIWNESWQCSYTSLKVWSIFYFKLLLVYADYAILLFERRAIVCFSYPKYTVSRRRALHSSYGLYFSLAKQSIS